MRVQEFHVGSSMTCMLADQVGGPDIGFAEFEDYFAVSLARAYSRHLTGVALAETRNVA